MTLSEKSIVSALTLAGSLAAYFYAKADHKDVVPYVMIAGFAGAFVGELIVETIKKKSNGNTDNK